MTMTQTVKMSGEGRNLHFRSHVVKHLLNIRSQIPTFSRVCQFHAIAILDVYEKCLTSNHQLKVPSNENSFSYALAFLFIACKFNGINEKIIQKFINDLKTAHQQEDAKMKILQAEADILEVIDFQIPIQTCFTSLEYAAESDNSQEKKRPIFKVCLKIMLKSCQLNSTLTENPNLGAQLYDLIKNKSGKRRVIQLHQEVMKAMKKINAK